MAAVRKKIKRLICPSTQMIIHKDNTVYFSSFLLVQIGAGWNDIKHSLYESGWNAKQVSDYRDELINDFVATCRNHGYHWKI